jgi:hypothetical protein
MEIGKKAAIGVGIAAGVAAAAVGAPLWVAILAGSGGAVVTPKAIDKLSELLSKK